MYAAVMARVYHEDIFQRQVIEYIRLQYPHTLAFHVPNGGKRQPREAARLKLQGVVPGVSDILIFWRGGMGALELKHGKNKPSPHQDYFGDRWQHAGGLYAVCWNLDQVIALLNSWGVK